MERGVLSAPASGRHALSSDQPRLDEPPTLVSYLASSRRIDHAREGALRDSHGSSDDSALSFDDDDWVELASSCLRVCAIDSKHDETSEGPEMISERPCSVEVQEVKRTKHATVIQLSGFQYTRFASSMHKVSYLCSFYRRAKCKGRVDFSASLLKYTCSTHMPIRSASRARKGHRQRGRDETTRRQNLDRGSHAL